MSVYIERYILKRDLRASYPMRTHTKKETSENKKGEAWKYINIYKTVYTLIIKTFLEVLRN